MEFLKSAVCFIVILSTLVIAHEWGHFIIAKLYKMRVSDFSLFFGPRIVKLGVRNGTEYNIRSIPLGGFVKIEGMEPDDAEAGASVLAHSGDAKLSGKVLRGMREEELGNIDADKISERIARAVLDAIGSDARLTMDGKLELKALLASTALTVDEHKYLEAVLRADDYIPDPQNYNQKPIWQRAAAILAGPIMSLLFGYAVFCVMGFTAGLPDLDHDRVLVSAVVAGKPAAQAGVHPGDMVTAIDGKELGKEDPFLLVKESAGKPVTLSIQREGHSVFIKVTPTVDEAQKNVGHIGIVIEPVDVWKRYSPLEAIGKGSQFIWKEISGTFAGIFSRDAPKNLHGIVTIGRVIHEERKQGLKQVVMVAAMLSVSLGIINLFPIPVLDGGHLLLLAVEAARRRKLSSREVYSANIVGLAIILSLFVFVMYNDLRPLLTHH